MKPTAPFTRFAHLVYRILPKGLYARALLIVIAPMVILQTVMGYVFLERHWQLVTRRLSAAVTADIGALIDVYESYPQDSEAATLTRIAGDRLALDVDILPEGALPPPGPKPFFSILDGVLAEEIRRQISRPYWIDTVGRSNLIEVRIKLTHGVMRVVARRSLAYASNSHIFLLWMAGSSLLLLGVSVLILRNQIRPILNLSLAAEAFGKGQAIAFRPRGAREVRQAGHAFLEMRRRVESAVEQRTAMLNGVSHDLRTILTRFKLSLALMDATSDSDDLKADADEMTQMLEGYLAFARDETDEAASLTHMDAMLLAVKVDTERNGEPVEILVPTGCCAIVRPVAFRRLLDNLVSNARRHGTRVKVTVVCDERWLTVDVEDDGVGVPEDKREDVFKPFVRLDEARNMDEGGSGLGLAIVRDIARSHGGEIELFDSSLGGLRAHVRVPV